MKYTSVFPRARSPYWYVAYLDGDTGKRNPGKATPFRRDDPQGKRKALDYANTLAKKAAAFKDASQDELWGAWVEPFLERHYRRSDKSKTRALGAWSQWRLFLTEQSIVVPRALTHAHCISFVEWRSSQKKRNGDNISWNTALCDLRIMSAVMQEALRRGFVTANPCARPGLKRDDAGEKPEITRDEENIIRGALPQWVSQDRKGREWMINCFEVGIRQGCRLRETQLDVFRDVAEDLSTVTFRAKGRKTFATQLHPALHPIITQLRRKNTRYVCQVPLLGSKYWREFFDSLDMPHLCFHCTRVTVVTRLARAGVTEQQAMAYVGHASRLIHKIYQRLKPSDSGAAVAALS